MDRLKNKVAIVTGSADGIGLFIAKAFVDEGTIVVMGDVNERKCKEEANRFLSEGKLALPCYCDVGDTKSVLDMVSSCVKNYNKVDILVNNAAVAISGNIIDMPENNWDKLMNINLKGIFRCTQACIPFMINAQKGSVINISSVQAVRSWDNWTCYAAAKGGILAMTNQLAGQFGSKNIRFNTISPGTIETPMLMKRITEEGDSFRKANATQSPLGRNGCPEEVAMAAVFLASDESSFITGEDIKVDGGLCSMPRYLERI